MIELSRSAARVRPLVVLALVLVALGAAPASGQESPDAPVRELVPVSPVPERAEPRPPGGGAPSEDAWSFGSPPALAAGLTEEEMWPAATAEGWAKPCLVPWQRTFDDAVKVAREAGAPILVCVNMDGEIASEHYAGVRYRDPETAKALEPYVCVVASVYRHAPRDYDENGRRVECPRFGTVTCGEHIANEVELYAKYFDGRRISPRHIMLDLDGEEVYDVYHSWDTATVFTAFAKGAENLPPRRPTVRDGMTVEERAASSDVADRVAVERAYLHGDRETRVSILRALSERDVRHKNVRHDDVLRLAMFGLDLECASIARQVLAQSDSPASIDLIAEALKAPMDAAERDALVAAAARLGEKDPRARMLATIQQGLSMGSGRLGALDGGAEGTEGASAAEYAADAQRRAESAERSPEDPEAKLQLAESLFACANDATRDASWRHLALEDARRSAEEAARLGLESWRLDAVLAAVLAQLDEPERAREHAVRAVEGGLRSEDAGAAGPPELVRARVLTLFSQARQLAIRRAYQEKKPWPPEWLADVNAVYSELAAHDSMSEEDVLSYYDFLSWLGGARKAGAVLEEALARFPESAALHERLRARVLWEKGPAELESEYARRLAAPAATRQLTWFAGYASLVAAEHFRRRNDHGPALEAYARGIAHYERNVADAPEGRELCDHFIAIAHASRARVLLERGELDAATDAMLAAFARSAGSTGTMDGLGITPGMTALMLRARLADAQRADLSARLTAAMDSLDPALFREPDFARSGASGGGR